MAVEELVELFAPPTRGPAQDVTYRQGRILAWNTTTAQNTVDVGGTTLTDLPVLNTSEALLLKAGDVVSLLAIRSVGGVVTYGILGRLTIPNTPEAASALNALSQGIESANVDLSDTITSTSFAAAPTNPGPAVTVQVRTSGRVLVLLTALVQADTGAQITYMSFAISGASTASAVNERSLQLGSLGEGAGVTTTGRMTATVYVTGLTAGETTFTAQYRRNVAAGTAAVDLRNITVIPL